MRRSVVTAVVTVLCLVTLAPIATRATPAQTITLVTPAVSTFQPFLVGASAQDTAAAIAPGVDRIELYAYRQPETGEAPILLGAANAAALSLPALTNMPGGTYRFAVRARSTVTSAFFTDPSSDARILVKEVPHADFTGDNRPDLLGRDDFSGQTRIWSFAAGTTTVGSELPFFEGITATILQENSNWELAATSDFSWDLKGALVTVSGSTPDVMWRNPFTGDLKIWQTNRVFANQAFVSTTLDPNRVADTAWHLEASADLNGDGSADEIWRHVTTGYVAALLMNRRTMISSDYLDPPRISDTGWQIVGTGDFNHDLKTDIVWQHQARGSVAIFLMNGTSMIDSVYADPMGLSDVQWKLRAVADVDYDGWPDLVFQHELTGQMQAWLMNGTRMRSSEYVMFNGSSYAPHGWRIAGPR